MNAEQKITQLQARIDTLTTVNHQLAALMQDQDAPRPCGQCTSWHEVEPQIFAAAEQPEPGEGSSWGGIVDGKPVGSAQPEPERVVYPSGWDNPTIIRGTE